MARKTSSALKRAAAKGRNGDDRLAHLSQDEIELAALMQGGISINPETGLPEFFSFKKVLKGVGKALAGLAGGAIAGPAGAAIGTGVASAVLGDDLEKSLSNGLLAGLSGYAAQQTGAGDYLGISSLGRNADLLGRTGGELAIQTASGSKGGGISSLLPMLGLGALASAAGTTKAPKLPTAKPDNSRVPEYERLDRDQQSYEGDPYTYGQVASPFIFFDQVNPELKPLKMKYGGNVSEGGKKQGASERGGQGPNADRGDRNRDRLGGDKDLSPAGPGPGARSIGNRGGVGGQNTIGNATVADRMMIDKYMSRPKGGITDDRSYWDAVRNLGTAAVDYNNTNQGFTDDPLGAIGRIIGGVFGVGEIDPTSQELGARTKKPEASWGIDPIGAALGLGGAAGLTPFGLGGLWQGAKALSGYQGPMIAFDGNQPLTNWRGTSALDSLADTFGLSGNKGQPAQPGGSISGGNDGRFGGITSLAADPVAAQLAKKKRDRVIRPEDRDQDEESTGRTVIPLANPFTYGQAGPEHIFFDGQIPVSALTMAFGGAAQGPGDGKSDSIPAMLSDGEYVLDAATVAAIGKGSTNAGFRKLDAMRRELRNRRAA